MQMTITIDNIPKIESDDKANKLNSIMADMMNKVQAEFSSEIQFKFVTK